MKLIKRNNGIWYISFGRNKLKSTGTKNKPEAVRIFNAVRSGQHQTVFGKNAKPNITLQDAKDIYLRLRYDLSEGTLKKDRTALAMLAHSVGDEISISEINENLIEKFKMDCIRRGVKKISVNAYLRHIKAFLNNMTERKYIDITPKIKMLKLGQQLPRFLSKDEIKLLLDYASVNDVTMYRIIVFAIYTGCRREEIANADYKDVMDNGFIKVIGKGNKQRSILLLPEACAVLDNPTPKSGNIFDMRPDRITRSFKKIANACGVNDVHFHILRHTAATNMLVNEMELSAIQKILGHTAISTTQIYTHAADQYLADQMRKLKY